MRPRDRGAVQRGRGAGDDLTSGCYADRFRDSELLLDRASNGKAAGRGEPLSMGSRPHFRAHVRLRPTDEGGRRGAIDLSRYRPDLSFAVDDKVQFGTHPARKADDESRDVWIAPGQEFDADFQIRSAASQIMSRLEVGSQFRMLEGHHPTGDGTVTQIHRTDD